MKTHAPASEYAQQRTQVATQEPPLIAQAASTFEAARPETMALQRYQNMAAESPHNARLTSPQTMASASPRVKQLQAMKTMASHSTRATEQRHAGHVAAAPPVQHMNGDGPLQTQLETGAEPAQLEAAVDASRPNNTGLPDQLKSGIESLSGMSMDHVKVHYNSAKPAQLQAHAYAQGSEIHVGPGQEQHLPHEAWHVVQQAQGRVRPTVQIKGGVAINDDLGLEREADLMGARALDAYSATIPRVPIAQQVGNDSVPIQCVVTVINESDPDKLWLAVKGSVASVYKRKKTLFEWSARAKDFLNFDSYDDLANALDFANQSRASMGRTRPNWTPKIKDHFDKTWGGKRHRRHIIMSSLMRDAVYAVTDNQTFKNEDKLIKYNEIIARASYAAYDATSLANAENALVYVLHNNPANLVLDSGIENSAIGSMAHNFNAVLQQDDAALGLDFKKFQTDPNAYLIGMVKGFQEAAQLQIIEIIKTFPRPNDLNAFREYLEIIFDNTAVDVMTKEKLPEQGPELLSLHGRFVAAEKNGDLEILYGTAMSYVGIGMNFKPPYSEIW